MDIVNILTALISFCIAIIGWFIKDHITSVKADVKKTRSELASIKQDIIWLTNKSDENKKLFIDSVKEHQKIYAKFETKLEDIEDSSYSLLDKIKQHEKHLENYGQVIRLLATKNNKNS